MARRARSWRSLQPARGRGAHLALAPPLRGRPGRASSRRRVTQSPDDALAVGVRELVAEAEGSDPGAIALSAIPGGASRETFLAEAGERRWVIRRDPLGAPDSFAPLETEFRVVQAAAAARVPVAPPIAFEPAGGRLMSAGFLMATSPGPRWRHGFSGATSWPPRAARFPGSWERHWRGSTRSTVARSRASPPPTTI